MIFDFRHKKEAIAWTIFAAGFLMGLWLVGSMV